MCVHVYLICSRIFDFIRIVGFISLVKLHAIGCHLSIHSISTYVLLMHACNQRSGSRSPHTHDSSFIFVHPRIIATFKNHTFTHEALFCCWKTSSFHPIRTGTAPPRPPPRARLVRECLFLVRINVFGLGMSSSSLVWDKNFDTT